MAQKFVLNAALNIQAPNLSKVVRNINNQLQGVAINLNVPNAAQTNKAIQNVNKNLNSTSKSAKIATTNMQKLGASVGSTIGQFIKYDIARAAINLFSRAITDGLADAIKFEREMVKIAQVTGATTNELKSLEREISRVATSMGVASMSLLQASRVLAQTGMEAGKVKVALEALAKTTLAPTFDSIADTTETAVAVMAQFKVEAKDLEGVLGSINAVAGKFAVEAGDIGVAIRRTGGAFKSAGGSINELIALFTSVRSTTRETAETIATGFRTIFTRMQRPGTIKFLEQFGVKLQDLNGHFVGPLEAVKRLHLVLKNLDPRDVRYSQIVEQLGGFRQVSKVIPLIQEFKVTQEALNVAVAGSGSLAQAAAKAQGSFAVKIMKLKEEVKELFRVISESTAFKVMLDGAIGLAKALTNIATALGPLIPMLAAVFAMRGIGAIGGAIGGIRKGISTQGGTGFARGGIVPGTGTGDTVPASLTPGEFVIRKSAVEAYGAGNLAKINKYAAGGPVKATGKGLRSYSDVGSMFNKKSKRDWDKNAGSPFNREGGEQAMHQFGLKDNFTATNTIKKIGFSDAQLRSTPALADAALQFRRSKDNRQRGIAWERVLRASPFPSSKLSSQGIKKGGTNAPLDGKINGVLGDAALNDSSHSKARIAQKLFRHQMNQGDSQFLDPKKVTWSTDKFDMGGVTEFLPGKTTYDNLMNFVKNPKKSSRKSAVRKRRAGGGAITSQGTDSIPALLTPGEFVINKKSAQSMGYDKLSGINKYAKGGVVGGSGSGSRVKMFGGGGMMDMLMMMLMGGGGGGGGQGNQTGAANSSAALNNLAKTSDKTSKTLGSSLGSVTSGLGKVAQSSLMAYSKIQFFGAALDATITSVFGESEAVHKVVSGLTTFVSVIYTATAALNALKGTQILQGLGSMFSSVGGPAIAQAIGTPLKDMMTWIVGDKIMGSAGKKVKALGRGMQKMPGVDDFNRMSGKGMSMKDMEGLRGRTNAKAQQAMANARRAAGPAHGGKFGLPGQPQKDAKFWTKKASRLTGKAKGLETAIGAGKGMKAAGAAKMFKGLLKPMNLFGLAVTIAAVAAGKMTSSQQELDEKIKNSDSWQDVESTARSRAKGAGLDAMGEAGMAKIAAKVALKVGTKMLATKGVRMAAGAAASGGTNMLVEIPLLVAELAYGVAMATDTMNNAIADFNSAQFAKKQKELANAFDAFKDGTLNSGAMATKLADTHKLNAVRAKEIDSDKNTGKFGVAAMTGEGGSISVMKEAFAAGDYITAAGASIASSLNAVSAVFGADLLNGLGVQGFWGRDNDAIEADSGSLSRGIVEQREMAPDVVEGAMQEAFAKMRSTKDSDIGAAGDDAFIKGLGGIENATVIAGMMGVEIDVLRKRFKEQADELKPIIEAEKKFEKAQLEMARSTRAAVDIIMGIRSIAPAIAELESRIGNTFSGFSGGISAGNMVDKSPQFSTEAVSSISNSEQWDNLEANVGSLTGYLGAAGGLIKKEFLGGALVMSALPDALETLKDDMTNLTGDTSDAGDRVIDEIKARIESSGGKWDLIPETIKNRIRAKINSLDINAENFDENFDTILEDASSAFDPYNQAIQDASGTVTKYNKIHGAALAQRSQMEMSFIQGQMKILKLQESGAEMIRQATGGELTAADTAAEFKAGQQTLLGAGSGLVGGAVTDSTGGAASNLGVGGLGDLYKEQKQKMAALNKEMANATATSLDAGKDSKRLQTEFDELQRQTEKTKQALEAYTDVQKRAAGIQAELSREQEARKTKRGALSDFAFADDAGRGSQMKGMESAFTAIQAGDLGAVDESQRGAVGSFLDKFENVTLQAFGGKTGGDIKKELEIKEFEKVMGRDLSGDEKKSIMESTSKEDQLINDLRALNEEAEAAQSALNDGMKVSIEEMNTNIADLNEKFLKDLKEIFGARQKARLKSEEGKADKGIADTTSDLGDARNAVVSVIGEKQFKELNKTEEGKKTLDDMLKVLTSSKESLAKVKEATEKSNSLGAGIERMSAYTGSEGTGLADSIEGMTGAWTQWDDMTIDKTTVAIKKQTSGMAGMAPQGAGRESAIKASNKLDTILQRINAGDLTVSDAVAGDAAAASAFSAAGFGDDEKLKQDGITANEAAILAQVYMASSLNAEQQGQDSAISTATASLSAGGVFTTDQVDAMIGDSGTLTEKLASILPDSTFTNLNSNLEGLNETLADIKKAQADLGYSTKEPKPITGTTEFATGGAVYASAGMFIPKGTDTVPAMLTPGEFVVRRNAVKAVGMPLLQRINSMGKGGRQQGGDGYYADGGGVTGGLDFSGLDRSINQFSQQITRLGDALSGGFSINVGGEINVNVRLNGAEMLEGAKDALGQVAADKVEKGITRMLKQHFPKLNNKSGLHRIKE